MNADANGCDPQRELTKLMARYRKTFGVSAPAGLLCGSTPTVNLITQLSKAIDSLTPIPVHERDAR